MYTTLEGRFMKGMRFAVLVAATGLILAGCGGSVSVTSDYDPAADFSTLKTFSYVEVKRDKSDPLVNPLMASRVRNAIEKALVGKGFTMATKEEADFLVAAHAGAKEKMNVTDWGYGYGPYWGPYPYGRNIDVSYYTEASIVVDVVKQEAGKAELLWRGIGTGVVQKDNPSPAEMQERLDWVMEDILYEFPPTKKK
jgi:hypothetical protein